MRRTPFIIILLVFAALSLSSYNIIAERALVKSGSWAYLDQRIVTDSSFWIKEGKPHIEFVKHQPGAKLDKHRIDLMFNKYPVAAGIYRIVPVVTKDDEVAVHIADGIIDNSFVYWSTEGNTSVVHVGLKDGKHLFWANHVLMEPWPRSAYRDALDSFRVSFNLSE